MPSPQEIAKAVWEYDGIKSPWSNAKTNPYVTGANALADTLGVALTTKALLDAVAARVDVDPAEVQRIAAGVQTALAANLAALPGAVAAELRDLGGVDSDAVVAAVERGLSRLRLVVADDASQG